MLPRLSRVGARALHMQRPPLPRFHYSLHHLGLAAGCSAVIASYFTWRLTSDKHRIALDGQQTVVVEPKSDLHIAEPSDSSSSPPETLKLPNETTTHEDESQSSSEGGAFNPETGEINWDCPCLGGMAHGPCGPEFREAFSCFVFSEQEPKGIDCVEKFKAMQTCFRAHPDVYGDDIMNDDDDEKEEFAPQPVEAGVQATSEGQSQQKPDEKS